MNRSELTAYLHSRNRTAGHTDYMGKYNPPAVTVDGREVFLFNYGFDINNSPTADSISISQQPYGVPIPLHMHNYLEMIYVFSGQCELIIDGIPVSLNEGQFLLINQDTPHEVAAVRQEDIIINLTLKKDFLSPAFLSRLSGRSMISQFIIDSLIDDRKQDRFLVFRPQNHEVIRNIMEPVMCEFFDSDFVSPEIIDSYMVILLSELIRHSGQQRSRLPAHSSRQKQVALIDFLVYIEEHYRECSLEEMGRHFGFHPNYLSALLKKATGKTYKELLQLQRLTQAALLLSGSRLPVPDIAEEVGYSSVTFFYRKFKDLFRMTPLQYRENSRRPSV
ncbi:AraC family transcriptional regulator [Paenibacillus sp. MMS20-IR301]|uniref:AraC family transcriptional regulator n=1 Tax=Paenibacillus sp. MMS20-IR301 TaxID=2895946 RepID=UPI0028E77473|nr:AraC family transcriptional regulator [Paenibacillus sp. MMS20-IR301]WNS43152.1 AraC family transcriptional regulator [Paenibacillus sp. MMS20-IR301]